VRELFIYYRATVDCADALQAAVLAMQSGLQSRHAGLQARLLRRPEPADGLHTWMETYALPLSPEGVCDALRQEIETAALSLLAPWVQGPRHTEVFVPCAC
jgi:hypothetical protein